LTKPQTE